MVFRFDSVKDSNCPGCTAPTRHLFHFQASGQLKQARWVPLAWITCITLRRISLLDADESEWHQRNLPPHHSYGTLHQEQIGSAKADKHYSTSKFHTQPLLGGQSPAPWRSESPLQASKTTEAKGNRVCSSLLLSARHKSMSTGPYFWHRHLFDISTHALPPGQHLAPPSPAVTSVVTLCWVSKGDTSVQVRCLFPLTHTKLMQGLAASLSSSNIGIVEVSPGK